jgi:hypothetical protein
MGMLPKIVKPTTTVISPITNQEIKISPFTMADQKALLLVQRSTNEDDIIEAMVQIIRNCSNADPTKLDAIEFQWLMLQVRNMSSGSTVDTNLICENCEKQTASKINLDSYVVVPPEPMEKAIIISEETGLGLMLKPIDVTQLSKIDSADDALAIKLVVDFIFDNENMYKPQDVPDEEFVEFVSNLPISVINTVTKWMTNVGSITIDKDWTCPHCGHKNHLHVEGIKDFFM